jgi:hypothetical protein
VYKVVFAANDKRLISAAVLPSMAVIYRVNQWTYPRLEGTPLMAFSKFADAYAFYNSCTQDYGGYRIYSCDVINPVPTGVVPDTTMSLFGSFDYKQLWHDVRHGTAIVEQGRFMYAPAGTVMCDAIMLKRCVRRYV